MAKLISRTYGEAIFELAVADHKVDIFMEEIQVILSVLNENPQFADIMNHPKIIKEEKLQVMEEVFGGRISDELTGFLRLIVTKGRYQHVQEIMEYFLDQVKQLKGIGVAHVTSAVELKENQKKAIEDKLIATTTYQQMEMHYYVDEKLIGGLIIRIGDRVVDSSIQTKLYDLERKLMKIQLQSKEMI